MDIDVFDDLEYFLKSMCGVFFVFLFAGNALKNFYQVLAKRFGNMKLTPNIYQFKCVRICKVEEQRKRWTKKAREDQLNKFSSQIELEIRAKNC